ncbi:MAG: hypothetical protein MRY21_06135 [Simkaniaceae bacterium]|nr:hypothetical protein [Simkaniaceae bacterium]
MAQALAQIEKETPQMDNIPPVTTAPPAFGAAARPEGASPDAEAPAFTVSLRASGASPTSVFNAINPGSSLEERGRARWNALRGGLKPKAARNSAAEASARRAAAFVKKRQEKREAAMHAPLSALPHGEPKDPPSVLRLTPFNRMQPLTEAQRAEANARREAASAARAAKLMPEAQREAYEKGRAAAKEGVFGLGNEDLAEALEEIVNPAPAPATAADVFGAPQDGDAVTS